MHLAYSTDVFGLCFMFEPQTARRVTIRASAPKIILAARSAFGRPEENRPVLKGDFASRDHESYGVTSLNGLARA